MPRETLAVEGLREFQRGLRQINPEFAKALRLAGNESANYLIQKVRPGIPRRSGRAAASLKARSSQTSVRIAVGGRRAPYYPWLDFGGSVGRADGIKRPFFKDGRYIYPTFYREKAAFQRILEQALLDVARSAGVEVE